MTALFDRAFIALGVEREELEGFGGRQAIYTGLIAMSVTATTLLGGIFSNIAAPVA